MATDTERLNVLIDSISRVRLEIKFQHSCGIGAAWDVGPGKQRREIVRRALDSMLLGSEGAKLGEETR